MIGRSILSSFPTEKVRLKKKNGEIISDINALVESDKFFIDDSTIRIEEEDVFIRNLPNEAVEYYLVIERGFHRGTGHGISDHYQTSVKKISEAEYNMHFLSKAEETREKMVFISHSSKDIEYIKCFVDLLETLGLHEDEIVCSSIPPYCIPLGGKVYDWLVDKFQNCDLHVMYMLSGNYYESAASLNEMGAAWAMKQKWNAILLPGFEFTDIRGCIDTTQIGIKLDDCDIATLKYRLGELRNDLTEEFGLRKMSDAVWERRRDEFLDKIAAVDKLSDK